MDYSHTRNVNYVEQSIYAIYALCQCAVVAYSSLTQAKKNRFVNQY